MPTLVLLAAAAAALQPPLVAQRKAELMSSLVDLRRSPTRPARDAVLRAVESLEDCAEKSETHAQRRHTHTL